MLCALRTRLCFPALCRSLQPSPFSVYQIFFFFKWVWKQRRTLLKALDSAPSLPHSRASPHFPVPGIGPCWWIIRVVRHHVSSMECCWVATLSPMSSFLLMDIQIVSELLLLSTFVVIKNTLVYLIVCICLYFQWNFLFELEGVSQKLCALGMWRALPSSPFISLLILSSLCAFM